MNSKPSDQNSEGRIRGGGGAAASASLGEQLRLAREQRGISLREISDHTRISMRYLEAIEADDYKHLPGGIFNRSFIKAYARHIDFDEQQALEAYARTAGEHGESPDEVATSPTRSRIYMDGESSRSPLLTALLSAIILGILVLGVYAGLHFYQRRNVPSAIPDGGNSQTPSSTQAPSGGGNQTTAGNAAQSGASGGAAAPGSSTAQPQGGFQIQIKAKGEQVWVGAQLDEQPTPDFTLNADQTREFSPQNRFTLRYSKSKADALEVFINGQVAQAPAANPKTGLVEWVITRDDYKQYLP